MPWFLQGSYREPSRVNPSQENAMRSVTTVSALLVVLAVAALHAADNPLGRPYLALGDSITFGFITNAGFAYLNPDNFIGFPNYLSQRIRLEAVNASCPGETTGSFLSASEKRLPFLSFPSTASC